MELPSANKSTFQLRENVRLTFSRLDFHCLSYGLISSLRKGGGGEEAFWVSTSVNIRVVDVRTTV